MSGKYSVNITGSTVGAMAVGGGATANSAVTAADRVGGKFMLDIKGRFASRGRLANWLRVAADRVDEGTGAEDHFAETVGPASFSMALDCEQPGAVAHVNEDMLIAEIKALALEIAERNPDEHKPGKRLLGVVRDVLRREAAK